LTCRQLIRYRDPSRIWLEKLAHAKNQGGLSGHAEKVVDDILRLTCFSADHQLFEENAAETVGFFPFEIQVMDLNSFQRNSQGDANHLAYKKSQVRASRRRVLGAVLTFKE
jgi:uncharacterized protein (TIGR04562 family)